MQFCFLSSPAVVPADSAGSIGLLTFDQKNRADGAEANDAPTLLSVRKSNLRSEDMVELRRQGISIDDDNDPTPENVPRQGDNNNRTI